MLLLPILQLPSTLFCLATLEIIGMSIYLELLHLIWLSLLFDFFSETSQHIKSLNFLMHGNDN
ncbi:unnamed protein product [Protopolystoma xenopodis]|uniref:Uncharacterized protein n=1 Tax=Protopolystoma xenopodis TaxID=117903 RepID=A0A3S5CKU8_9PLAT|nr:unnamed protein product [Protopolystoma xenopodis]